MNTLHIAGRLGRDPESRFTPSGQKLTKLVIAVNVYKAGKEETMWFNVTVWGDEFDKMLAYCKKGTALIVVGEMSKPEIYTDKEGRPQASLNMTAKILHFSPFGGTDSNKQDQGATSNYTPQSQQTQNQNYGSVGEQPFGYSGSNSYSPSPTAQSTQFGQGSMHAVQEETIPF